MMSNAAAGVNTGAAWRKHRRRPEFQRMIEAVTPQMLSKFARTARQRIRPEGGGYRRGHLRALAQRVEVAEGEVRIMGSKSRLLQTLVANGGANAAPIQGLNRRCRAS